MHKVQDYNLFEFLCKSALEVKRIHTIFYFKVISYMLSD